MLTSALSNMEDVINRQMEPPTLSNETSNWKIGWYHTQIYMNVGGHAHARTHTHTHAHTHTQIERNLDVLGHFVDFGTNVQYLLIQCYDISPL